MSNVNAVTIRTADLNSVVIAVNSILKVASCFTKSLLFDLSCLKLSSFIEPQSILISNFGPDLVTASIFKIMDVFQDIKA